MHALVGLLIPLIVTIGVALIIWICAERFSPDPVITKIIQVLIFILVLVVILTKLLPLLGLN